MGGSIPGLRALLRTGREPRPAAPLLRGNGPLHCRMTTRPRRRVSSVRFRVAAWEGCPRCGALAAGSTPATPFPALGRRRAGGEAGRAWRATSEGGDLDPWDSRGPFVPRTIQDAGCPVAISDETYVGGREAVPGLSGTGWASVGFSGLCTFPLPALATVLRSAE